MEKHIRKGMIILLVPGTGGSEFAFDRCRRKGAVICGLQKFDLSYVRSLKEHYESKTPRELTEKIRSISGFKGLKTPSVKHNGLFFPDLSSRYFTADFPYGLAVLIQIAELYNVEIPNMKSTMEWYYSVAGSKRGFELQQYSIYDKSDLEYFYNKY